MVTYGPPQSAYTTQTPATDPINLQGCYGNNLTFAVAGRVTGMRYWRSAANAAASHVLRMWYASGPLSGTQMGSGTTSGESGSGWKLATFAAPVDVVAGQVARVVVNWTGTENGVRTAVAPTGPDIVNGDLSIDLQGYTGGGLTNIYPTGLTSSTFFVDVIFEAQIADPVEPPVVVIPPVEERPPVPATELTEVRLAGVAVDPCRIALPMSVTHGRSEIGVQPDPPTASILWDGPDCPYKIGDTAEIWAGVEGFLTATYDDPVARYDDDFALYDGGTTGVLSRRFLGIVAGITAQARLGVVTGWELECVGVLAQYGRDHVKTTRPAETDVQRAMAVAGLVGLFPMNVQGTATVQLAAGELDGDALSLWHDVCEASGGLWWQAADGGIVYELADHRATDSTPVGTIQCEVIDDEVEWTSNVDDIINHVTVSWGADSSASVTHVDGPSTGEPWGRRHVDIATTLATEADADQLGLLVLARRAWPFYGMTNGLVAVDALDPARLARFHQMEIGTPVLVPIPAEPGPTPSDPTPVVVEGWVETWDVDGHTAQMAFSDQKRWALTTLRDYDDVRGHDYAYWKAGDYMDMLVEVPA